MSADAVVIAGEFDRSIQAVSRAQGSSLVLTLAFATDVWSVLSVKLGKRPVFLASTLLMFAGAMIASWSELGNNFVTTLPNYFTLSQVVRNVVG